MFYILGKLKGEAEIIDQAESYSEAQFLLKEYRTAFQSGWFLWVSKDLKSVHLQENYL